MFYEYIVVVATVTPCRHSRHTKHHARNPKPSTLPYCWCTVRVGNTSPASRSRHKQHTPYRHNNKYGSHYQILSQVVSYHDRNTTQLPPVHLSLATRDTIPTSKSYPAFLELPQIQTSTTAVVLVLLVLLVLCCTVPVTRLIALILNTERFFLRLIDMTRRPSLYIVLFSEFPLCSRNV